MVKNSKKILLILGIVVSLVFGISLFSCGGNNNYSTDMEYTSDDEEEVQEYYEEDDEEYYEEDYSSNQDTESNNYQETSTEEYQQPSEEDVDEATDLLIMDILTVKRSCKCCGEKFHPGSGYSEDGRSPNSGEYYCTSGQTVFCSYNCFYQCEY